MNEKPITIRPAQPSDFPAIADILNRAYDHIGVDLGETAETVQERNEEALVMVLEAHETILATITAAPSGSYYGRMASAGQAEISRLAVAPEYQGEGLGTAMLATVAESCRRQGIAELVGASLDTMTTAHHMYETAGAKPKPIPGVKARAYVLPLTETEG